MRNILFIVIALLAKEVAGASTIAPVVFLEPRDSIATNDSLPLYSLVSDSSRLEQYQSWLDNDGARWALQLYTMARNVVAAQRGSCLQPDTFFIALIPGGNYAGAGFRLSDQDVDHTRTAFVKLGPNDWRFEITLLHETGHVVLYVLNNGQSLPQGKIAPIAHSTAALTDRMTAFDEGYAIHLETSYIHWSDDRHIRNKYRHEEVLAGEWIGFLAEYYQPISDYLSFSQSVARYREVRDNTYSFASAWDTADYLRVQLDRARDFGKPRTANQLLQSEGFYATFFFSFLARGKARPGIDTLWTREERLVATLAHFLGDTTRVTADSPLLTDFVEEYVALYPTDAKETIDLLLDLSHGVFIDEQAPVLWQRYYRAALSLDFENLNRDSVEARRAAWRQLALSDPEALRSQLGPQIRCEVPDVTVNLVALGDPNPLSFDVNTVQPGIMRLITGINSEEVTQWVNARAERPFASRADFLERVNLSEKVRISLQFN